MYMPLLSTAISVLDNIINYVVSFLNFLHFSFHFSSHSCMGRFYLFNLDFRPFLSRRKSYVDIPIDIKHRIGMKSYMM